jgi:cytochrome c peroxidase
MTTKKTVQITFGIVAAVIATMAFTSQKAEPNVSELRAIYSSGDQSKWPEPNIDPTVKESYKEIGLLDSVPFPEDNKFNEAKKLLGKTLFFDPRMSVSNQIACASCHDPQTGWGDGKRVAFGHDRQVGTRNAMTLFNTAYYSTLFWDGRAFSLEHQAHFPTMDKLEMNQPLDGLVKKFKKINGYKPMFKAAFGTDEISNDRIFEAIATFERTIVSPKSRFDLFIQGKKDALTDDEVMGLHLFRTKAACVNCHNGGLFSDNKFHNDGQALFGTEGEDLGLYNRTKRLDHLGLFRTQSLREVANTGPWMHHGNFPTLKDVVQFYNLGNPAPIQKKYLGTGRDSLIPKPSPLLKKLNLNDKEVDQVIAFLQSITTIPQRMKPITEFPK